MLEESFDANQYLGQFISRFLLQFFPQDFLLILRLINCQLVELAREVLGELERAKHLVILVHGGLLVLVQRFAGAERVAVDIQLSLNSDQ